MTEDAVQFTVRQRDALLELNSMLYETDDELEIQAKILDLSILLIQHSDYTKKRSSLIYPVLIPYILSIYQILCGGLGDFSP